MTLEKQTDTLPTAISKALEQLRDGRKLTKDEKVSAIKACIESRPQLLTFKSGLIEEENTQEHVNLISLFSIAGLGAAEAADILDWVLTEHPNGLDGITLKWILPQLETKKYKEIWKNHKAVIKKNLNCKDWEEFKKILANLRDILSRIKSGNRNAVVW